MRFSLCTVGDGRMNCYRILIRLILGANELLQDTTHTGADDALIRLILGITTSYSHTIQSCVPRERLTKGQTNICTSHQNS